MRIKFNALNNLVNFAIDEQDELYKGKENFCLYTAPFNKFKGPDKAYWFAMNLY